MSYKNKYDNRGCSSIDADATTLFLNLCAKKKFKTKKATPNQDKYEHWDWEIKTPVGYHLVDIKGLKRINSQDTAADDSLLCVEYENVTGNDGWLQGKAEFIAFLVKEGFIFVKRADLLELSRALVDWNSDPTPSPRNKKPYIVYQRSQWNRKDLFAYLKKEDILKLKHSLWRANV